MPLFVAGAAAAGQQDQACAQQQQVAGTHFVADLARSERRLAMSGCGRGGGSMAGTGGQAQRRHFSI
ncbi:hypothetical protein GQ37_026690 [Janthinobacterium sp. BJB1]|nr:hypothetical protein CSQ90_27580 [Janthinobacterium sp. BJB303]PJC95607.1 hypothetical protein GQ37_026690 [Janthinobacterium sp. BJB1]